MAVVRFLHILTIVSLAILHGSFDARPVHALSVERGHLGRDLSHAHAEIAKKRADSSKKCRPRPLSASQSPAPTTTPHANYVPLSKSEPTQTTSSSQPASTNTPASTVGSKIMLGWSNNEQPSIPNFVPKSKQRRLIYNWKLIKYPDVNIDSLGSFEFVPTVHDPKNVGEIAATLTRGYANYVMFFNEPEIPSQANVSPGDTLNYWITYMEPLAQIGYKLVAPSVTGAGLQWLETFLGLCKQKCHIYALNFHYYGLTSGDFQTTVNKFHELDTALPMWVTEVGCHDYSGNGQPCTSGIFEAMFSGVMGYVEATEWIHEIAWFGMFTVNELPNGVEAVNSMITCPSGDGNSKCTPSSLGYQYLDNYN